MDSSKSIDNQPGDKEVPSELPVEGLSQKEAEQRLVEYGPNSLPEQKIHLFLMFLKKMWGPVPWMLELSVILEIILGKDLEAGIIGALIIFNALMSTLQESKAQNALTLLRNRLSVNTRVLRDGKWQKIPSRDIVPNDVIYLRMGDLVPADAKIISGQISLDQSSLTGESMAVDVENSGEVFAGTVIVRGEATAIVSGTGTNTKFGKTAELVRLAKTTGQLEKIVFSITRYLVILDIILAAMFVIDSLFSGMAVHEILPFALILLVASVPVALPATFTLATALGASTLAKNGVLVTRLSAIEEAASMQILCTDKTGTLTANKLTVADITAFEPYSKHDVIRFGLLASDIATQDPLDKAIFVKAQEEGIEINPNEKRLEFIPFDPSSKRSEAVVDENGQTLRVLKGASQVIGALDPNLDENYNQIIKNLSSQGSRVLAVGLQTNGSSHVVGLIAFQDPPRADSANLIAHLKELGIRITMITGDSVLTAKSIASKLGIGNKVCSCDALKDPNTTPDINCEIFAEVLPEDKFRLVERYQQLGMIVGMTGDGVNDAPALKQAEVGVAVASAADVAKAAASLVLITPGLSSLVNAVETSRMIYQRMLTYTLNKIIKTIEIVIFLSFGLIIFHTFVTTPLLMILLIFTNDFVTMSISTDNVIPSGKPNHWNVRSIIIGAIMIALPILILSFGIFIFAQYKLHLPLANLQTLLFVMLVFSGQGTVYLVRERHHFWKSRPGKWMVIGTTADFLAVGFLASSGILMAPIPLPLIGEVLGLILIYLFILDFLKVPIFTKLELN